MSVSIAKARAKPTLCCIPPESSCGNLLSHSLSPTISSCSRAFLRRSALPMPCISSPKATLSNTVNHGISANFWNTIDTRWVRRLRRVCSSQLASSTMSSPSLILREPREIAFKPLTARSKLDLPEPDSPINTQISPCLMFSETLSTPTTCPVSSMISWRDLPWSSCANACSC
ncbi:hypothetical protein AND4_09407 [Vibrio sp. AND4]|nr:hypothetical protein AND4_09407 [Vibrio sp. AND4]